MKVNFYLVVNRNGTIKTTKGKPSLAPDEISIALALELPVALFQKPILSASIVIPDEAAMPQEINAEVAENVKDAIEQATNLKVHLTIGEPSLNV